MTSTQDEIRMETPEEHDEVNDNVPTGSKRGRGRPKKNQEPKEKAAPEIPSRDLAMQAAQQFFTLDVMIKRHDQEMKERKKQKSEAGKIVKLYFEGNHEEEVLGQVECTRKSKIAGANMEKVRQVMTDEILADPLRKGNSLIRAISDRIEAEEEEKEFITICSNKEAIEAAMGV